MKAIIWEGDEKDSKFVEQDIPADLADKADEFRAVIHYLPSPPDREAFSAIDVKTGEPTVRRPLDTEPLSMLAFKIMDDPHVGSITFCRVYSGTVRSGMALANTTRDRKERVGRMYLMHADEREQIEEAYAGDIIAFAGLK